MLDRRETRPGSTPAVGPPCEVDATAVYGWIDRLLGGLGAIDPDKRLRAAVNANDPRAIARALKRGGDPNLVVMPGAVLNPGGFPPQQAPPRTLLVHVLFTGRPTLIDVCLDAGADPRVLVQDPGVSMTWFTTSSLQQPYLVQAIRDELVPARIRARADRLAEFRDKLKRLITRCYQPSDSGWQRIFWEVMAASEIDLALACLDRGAHWGPAWKHASKPYPIQMLQIGSDATVPAMRVAPQDARRLIERMYADGHDPRGPDQHSPFALIADFGPETARFMRQVLDELDARNPPSEPPPPVIID